MSKLVRNTSAKNTYVELCKTCDDIDLYNKPFWLDAVCGPENWDAIIVTENGEIVAGVPYYKKSKFVFKYITQPQLTQHFRIWIKDIEEKQREKALEYEFSIITEIAEGLLDLNADYVLQTYSPLLNDWEPFHWNGFEQETLYTFVIKRGIGFDEIQNQLSSNLKRDIKKAEKTARVEEITDLRQFYQYNCMSFERQGKSNPISFDLLESIYNACSQNDACKMLKASDENDEIHCVGFYAYDKNNVYELLLGTDPAKRASNFKSLMTLKMIQFASETNRNFDFEGSMIKSIANYNRRFGAELIPYFKIWKISSKNLIKRTALKIKLKR